MHLDHSKTTLKPRFKFKPDFRIRARVLSRIKHLANKFKESFFLGRTDGWTLFYEAKTDKKNLYNFTSLYPFVNKFGKYPLGHPRIIHSNFPPIERIFGLVQCKMTPPKNLYHPVLPYRSSGKLAFPLCAACAESLNQNPCRHNDSEQRLKACGCLKSWKGLPTPIWKWVRSGNLIIIRSTIRRQNREGFFRVYGHLHENETVVIRLSHIHEDRKRSPKIHNTVNSA